MKWFRNGTIRLKENAYSYKDNALDMQVTFDRNNFDQQPLQN